MNKSTTTLKGRAEPAADLEKCVREAQAARDGSVPQLQEWIDTGLVWRLEGSVGRTASDALASGACFLPDTPHRDYWGNVVPARSWLKPGSKGTLENSEKFYLLD